MDTLRLRGWALSAFVVTVAGLGAAAFAGCGGDDEGVPSDGVARVGDAVIKESAFEKWLKANPGQATGGQPAVVPDPPSFKRCVAAKRAQPQPKGAPNPSADQLKQLCQMEYEQRKRLVLEFLIEAEWVLMEAEEQDVKVSDAEVKRALDAQKQYSFADAKAYRNFLKTSGLKEEELLYRIRINTLQQKINEKVRKEAKIKEPTDAEVRRFYNRNKKRFAQPELRTVNAVVTETEDEARKARNALEGGQSFKQVVERYSVDEASKRQGGRILAAEGQQSRAPEEVFKAQKGELQGPVKTPVGYYVFEVTKITPASKSSFEEAKTSARTQLRSQLQQKAVEGYEKRFTAKYREITICGEGYKVPQCKNGPKEQPGSAPGNGAAPRPDTQQAPQTQPAPQQTEPPPPPSP